MAFDRLATISYPRVSSIALGLQLRGTFPAGFVFRYPPSGGVSGANLIADAADGGSRFWSLLPDGTNQPGAALEIIAQIRAATETWFIARVQVAEGAPLTLHGVTDTLFINNAWVIAQGDLKATPSTGAAYTTAWPNNADVRLALSNEATFKEGHAWDDIFLDQPIRKVGIWIDLEGLATAGLVNIVSGAPVKQRSIAFTTPYNVDVPIATSVEFEGVTFQVTDVQEINDRRDYRVAAVQDLSDG